MEQTHSTRRYKYSQGATVNLVHVIVFWCKQNILRHDMHLNLRQMYSYGFVLQMHRTNVYVEIHLQTIIIRNVFINGNTTDG